MHDLCTSSWPQSHAIKLCIRIVSYARLTHHSEEQELARLLIKVTGTRVYLEMTVTRFLQPMSILTPPSTKVGSGIEPIQTRLYFVTPTFCCGEATRTPWPLPHEILNSERIPQTFFVVCRIALSASRRSYKTWISRARAINEQVFRRTSPAGGSSTLEKWRSAKGVVTTRFPSKEEHTTLSPKHSSRPRAMIWAAI